MSEVEAAPPFPSSAVSTQTASLPATPDPAMRDELRILRIGDSPWRRVAALVSVDTAEVVIGSSPPKLQERARSGRLTAGIAEPEHRAERAAHLPLGAPTLR